VPDDAGAPVLPAPDGRAEGLEHLRTPLAHGVQILRELRGWTSGLAVPHSRWISPAAEQGDAAADYVVEKRARETVFRNYRGSGSRTPSRARPTAPSPTTRSSTAHNPERTETAGPSVITHLLESVALWIQGVISAMGYAGIAALMAIEAPASLFRPK